jgi:hypothetical protein
MNITYEWKITAMKKAPSLDGLSDVITHIRFDYTGTDADSGESHTFSGACPVGAPSFDAFTALADLTEADMNEVIEKAISDKVTPKNVDAEMPWAPAPETPAEPTE